jgi:thiol-disulfide isomerase/thioredoxin
MLVKYFGRSGCAACPPVRQVCKELEKEGVQVRYIDVETTEGRAEAVFYNILGLPAVLVIDEKGNEIEGWRGTPPMKKRVLDLFRKERGAGAKA